MKKSKVTVTRTAAELAKALGLTPADGAEIALRSDLNSKIIEVVHRKGLTHAQVARLARTSRTRLTAIMNRNTKAISTDLLSPLATVPLFFQFRVSNFEFLLSSFLVSSFCLLVSKCLSTPRQPPPPARRHSSPPAPSRSCRFRSIL